MKLFRTTEDSQAGLTQAYANIAKLEVSREKILAADEADIAEIARIDREIDKERANAAILTERIAIDGQRKKDQDRAGREKAKAVWLTDREKRLARRDASGAVAQAKVGEAIKALEQFRADDDACFTDWSDLCPPARMFNYLRGYMGGMFSTARQQRMSAGLFVEFINRAPYAFSAELPAKSRELIAGLKDAPIPDKREDEAA
jgi:hypothetical protein